MTTLNFNACNVQAMTCNELMETFGGGAVKEIGRAVGYVVAKTIDAGAKVIQEGGTTVANPMGSK